jgi:ribose transport system ATP-binding protein
MSQSFSTSLSDPSPTATNNRNLDSILVAENLSKSFGATQALRKAELRCRAGEVHALLGANGAGKSTLVRLLSGVIRPDTGTILLRGQNVRFSSPKQAAVAGLATVFQELSLFPHLTVAQNILIGQEPTSRIGWIKEDKVLTRAEGILSLLGEKTVDPSAMVETLSLGQRQVVEIAKALSHQPDILLLDEATSALGPEESARLFALVRSLRDSGKGIIFISHRMEEIEAIADRITILKDGETVGHLTRDQFDRSHIFRLMLGTELSRSIDTKKAEKNPSQPNADPIIRVENLELKRRLHDVSFEAWPGEILGLSGLEGQGQVALLHLLFGMYRRGYSGLVTINGRTGLPRSPWHATKLGLGLIPEDRKTQGAILPLSVEANFSLSSLNGLTNGFGLIRHSREQSLVRQLTSRLAVKTTNPGEPIAKLSGGNQQKVVIGKWLARNPSIFLFCDPTRGVDIAAKASIYDIVRQLAADGKGIIYYSTEHEELVSLCDRVIVFRDGRITGSLSGADLNHHNLLALSFGSQQKSGDLAHRLVGHNPAQPGEEGNEDDADRGRPQ